MMDDFESSTENLVPAEIAEAAERLNWNYSPRNLQNSRINSTTSSASGATGKKRKGTLKMCS
jgi:hypothetical protein